MTTTTLTATQPVYKPSRYELWRATQPAEPNRYEGRHRGEPAAEVTQDPAPAS